MPPAKGEKIMLGGGTEIPIKASRLGTVTLSIKVWGIRILIVAGIIVLGLVTRSSAPALGLTVAWCPNLLFLVAFLRGVLRFPRFLEPVRQIEPVVYRAL